MLCVWEGGFRVMIVGWQSEPVNTNENVLTVCNKAYHMNKWKVHLEEKIEVLRNFTLYTELEQIDLLETWGKHNEMTMFS